MRGGGYCRGVQVRGVRIQVEGVSGEWEGGGVARGGEGGDELASEDEGGCEVGW